MAITHHVMAITANLIAPTHHLKVISRQCNSHNTSFSGHDKSFHGQNMQIIHLLQIFSVNIFVTVITHKGSDYIVRQAGAELCQAQFKLGQLIKL